MANINKIRLSGTTYNIEDENASKTVELTQAQYDALATKEPNTYYVITDATAVDMANYYTKAQTDTALATKQATLVSGTNIKTINNESILGSGNIEIQGGATYTAGTNISIDTANTINCTLPIWVGTTNASALILNDTSNRKEVYKKHNGIASISYGSYSNALQPFSLAGGRYVEANNYAEMSVGFFNQSNGSSSAQGNNSGNTLFSVGNGASASARHNAFEIRQNGDIYVNDGTNDVRLQDTILALGGLKLVKISQSEYSAMEQAGTLDANTLYIVTNVVS